MKRLNIKLLAMVGGAMVLLAAGALLTHYLQTNRIADALLWQAQNAEQQGRPKDTVKYLSRYLEFAPDDVEQRAHLGELLAGAALAGEPRARERAYFVLEQVLLQVPDRHDLRLALVRVAMALRRAPAAKEHLDYLVKATPASAEVYRLLARWHESQEHYREAAASLRDAITHAPQDIDTYVALAGLLRRKLSDGGARNGAIEADQVMNDLVARNGSDHRAYLARWDYRKEFAGLTTAEQYREAGADVRRALELAADAVEVALAAAELAQLEGDRDRALAQLEQSLQRHPQEIRLYQALARLEAAAGRRDQAVAVLRRGAAVKDIPPIDQAELLWTLANLLLDEEQVDQAAEVLTELRKANLTAAGNDFLRGRMLIVKKSWADAARLLESARTRSETSPELIDPLDLHLARCYEQLSEPGRQFEALQRLVSRKPHSATARMGMAEAQVGMGRLDEAIKQYQQLLTLPTAPPQAWVRLARLRLAQNLQRSPADRRWKDVEEIVRKAQELKAATVETTVLQAEILAAQDQVDQAFALLVKARDAEPNQPEYWTALAALAERQGDSAKRDGLLADAQQRLGDTVDVRLARARHLVGRPADEIDKELDRLAAGADQFKAEDQARLLVGLGSIAQRTGKLALAARLWSSLTRLPRYENDPHLRLLLLDLALQTGDDAAAEQALKDLERIDGRQGVWWQYGEATRLVGLARKGNRARLDDARTYLDRVAVQRPAWAPVVVAKAELEEVKGNVEQAIALYRRAIELGDHTPRVSRQLVQLLYKRQRYDEAEKEIARLQREVQNAPELQRLAADISLRNQDLDRAITLAKQAVSTDSKDYRDHLWLGQMLAAGTPGSAEAERELRRAVELAEQVPETWVALVQFLVRDERTADAETVLNQARTKLPPAHAPLALAQCYEALGHNDQAEAQYAAALTGQASDVGTIRSAVSFYLRVGRLKEAEPHLRKVIDRKLTVAAADVVWARQGLGLVLAAGGDHARLNEALELVGLGFDGKGEVIDKLKPGEVTVDDRRAQARVLAAYRTGRFRTKAIAILEDLDKRQALVPDDQFILTQLYDAGGAWPKARDQLRKLTTARAAQPLHLAYAVQTLLRHREVPEAQRCYQQLEAIEKARNLAPGTLATPDFRVMMHEARGEASQAEALLKGAVAEKPDQPERQLALIAHYLRQRKFAEALDECDRAWEKCSPEAVATLHIAALHTSGASAERFAPVEGRLSAALDKNPKSIPLLMSLASLRDLQGRYADAEAAYRRILEVDSRHLLALNNLAWLLAQRSGSGTEALELINRAIAAAGPRPELLDTRATVYLALNRSQPAIVDLHQAIAEAPTANSYFRLARAEQLANNPEAARKALQKAKDAGLQLQRLHPAEQLAARKAIEELDRR